MSATTLDTLLAAAGVPANPFYQIGDASKILMVPRTSLNRLIRLKRIPAVKINRKQRLIPHAGLAAFVAGANFRPANDET